MPIASRPASPSLHDVEAGGLPVPQRYRAMLAIGTGVTVTVLDSSVASVALPTIARQLGASPAQATWVVNACHLATVVTLLPVAALGERFGYRRVYLFGLVVFTIGSLACALSCSRTALVLARLVQGQAPPPHHGHDDGPAYDEMAGCAGIAAPPTGQLSDRWPAAMLGAFGLAAVAAGWSLLATMPAHATSSAIFGA